MTNFKPSQRHGADRLIPTTQLQHYEGRSRPRSDPMPTPDPEED